MNIRSRDIVGFIIASRIPNLLVIAYTQFATAWFLMGIPASEIDAFEFSLLLLSTAMIGAGGYIINDYFDQKIDMINRPEKVVVGPNLRRRFALFSHVMLSVGGILIGFWIDPVIGAIHIFSTGALWTYSGIIRRVLLLSTLTISFLASLTVLVVMIYFRKFDLIVIAYALFGCTAIFIRETLKDIISSKGEEVFGIQSVPIVWGVRKAKLVIFLACFTGILLLFYYLWSVPNWTVRIFFVGLLPFIFWFLYRLSMADRMKHFKQLKLFLDVIIVSGLVSMCLV